MENKSVYDSSIYDVPDRKTGRAGAADIRVLYPGREWRFVEIDVPYAKAIGGRQRVTDLMNPLNTVMDLVSWKSRLAESGAQLIIRYQQSIAIAFWFAARGNGMSIAAQHKIGCSKALIASLDRTHKQERG